MTVTVKSILAAVCGEAGITLDELRDTNRRSQQVVHVRRRAWWLCRRLNPKLSFTRIGTLTGGFHYTTILYGVTIHDQALRDDPFERALCDELETQLAPAGLLRPIAALDALDARLLACAMAGRELQDIAQLVETDVAIAASRLTSWAEICARTVGRGLLQAGLYSDRPEGLLLVEPPEPPTPEALVALNQTLCGKRGNIVVDEPAVEFLAPVVEAKSVALPLPAPAKKDPIVVSPPIAPPIAPPAPKINPALPAPAVAFGRHRAPITRPVARKSTTGAPKVFSSIHPEPAVPARSSSPLSGSDRALIDAAIADGKVRQVRPDGSTELVYDMEKRLHVRKPVNEIPKSRSWGGARKAKVVS